MRRRLRRYHLRHKIHAIKTRPNNPLRFLQHKNSIRHYLANDLTFSSFAKRRSEQENVFTTNNTRPNQKINLLNQRALILTYGLTTATFNAPSDLYFSSSTPNLINQPQNQSKKQPTGTINQIKQSEKTRPRNHSIKSTQRQTQQAITTKCNVF